MRSERLGWAGLFGCYLYSVKHSQRLLNFLSKSHWRAGLEAEKANHLWKRNQYSLGRPHSALRYHLRGLQNPAPPLFQLTTLTLVQGPIPVHLESYSGLPRAAPAPRLPLPLCSEARAELCQVRLRTSSLPVLKPTPRCG